MLDKFIRFMYGRYGVDKFTVFLLVFSFIVSVFTTAFDLDILSLLPTFISLYGAFRVFSKNISARTKENTVFLKYWTPVEKVVLLKKREFDDRSTYKYFKCPNCKQQLRAPKGRGNIVVTCQKCSNQFNKKV